MSLLPYSRLALAAGVFSSSLMAWSLHAADSVPAISSLPGLTIPHLEGAIHVDGRLDEAQWQQAAKVTDFYPYDPIETGEPPGRTEAYMFYDDKTLYFGFRCHTPHPENIRAHIAPREDVNADDQIGIYLDTYNDNRQAFAFYINALGIQQDARQIEGSGWNQSWDTVFDSEGRVEGDGYVVEVGIPFRSLRFPSSQTQTWGIVLARKFAADGSKFLWPRVTHEQTNFIAQAAEVSGFKDISSGKHLEVQPTLVFQRGDALGSDQNRLTSPFRLETPGNSSISPGLSVKYGVTSNLILDATLNPDFSQVESDPNQLDINTRYALFYSERRPFFLEGSETLRGAQYLALNTRSIVSPLWGLKFSGKEGRTSIGFLTSYDTAPLPSITYSSQPVTPGFEAEDLFPEDGSRRGAFVSAARVAQDIGAGSVVGATLVDREVIDPATGKAYGYHRYGAVDAQLQLGTHDRLGISGEGAFTGMRNYEGSRTLNDIRGAGYALAYTHSTRKAYVELFHGFETPSFRAETAFLPLTGVVFSTFYTQYLLEPHNPLFVNIVPQIWVNNYVDPYGPGITDLEVKPGVSTRLAGQNYLEATLSHHDESYFGIDYPQQVATLEYRSDMFKVVTWEVGTREGDKIYYPALGTSDSVLGYAFRPYATLTLRPTPWLLATASYQQEVFLEKPRFSLAYIADALTGQDTPPLRYNQTVVRGAASLNFSQAWSLRAIAQVKSNIQDESSHLNVNWNVLLTYLPHPGTAAYFGVVHGSGWDQLGPVVNEDAWEVFIKLSYLWRI